MRPQGTVTPDDHMRISSTGSRDPVGAISIDFRQFRMTCSIPSRSPHFAGAFYEKGISIGVRENRIQFHIEVNGNRFRHECRVVRSELPLFISSPTPQGTVGFHSEETGNQRFPIAVGTDLMKFGFLAKHFLPISAYSQK